jgi:hypothetical protein
MKNILKKYKNLIPLLLLGLISLWTIINVLLFQVEFEGELYGQRFTLGNFLGFIILTINISVYFLYRKSFKYFVLAQIIIGLFGTFHYGNFRMTTDLNGLAYDSISFNLGVIYILMNFKRFKAKVIPKKLDQNVEYLPDLEKIEEFKYKYRNKEKAELLAITEDRRYIKEAKLAALELINQMEK